MATLESAVHEIGQQLHDPESSAHELASRVIDTFVERAVATSRGQITEMVKENLMKLDDEKIRYQIESKTRQHLDWIRVNGGIFGAIFGLMFALSRIVAQSRHRDPRSACTLDSRVFGPFPCPCSIAGNGYVCSLR